MSKIMIMIGVSLVLILACCTGAMGQAGTPPATCQYVLDVPTPGSTITLVGPADESGIYTTPRSYDYYWKVYNFTTGDPIEVRYDGTVAPFREQTFNFYAPDDNDYKVVLTVRDQEFYDACYDVRCVEVSVGAFACPYCEADTCEETALPPLPDPYSIDACPYWMHYPGPLGAFQLKWTIAGPATVADGAEPYYVFPAPEQFGSEATEHIDWSTKPAGAYHICFEVWNSEGTQKLNPLCCWNVTNVADPKAIISGTGVT